MKYVEEGIQLAAIAAVLGLSFACGGGAEEAEEPEVEETEGGEFDVPDEPAGESVDEMTDAEGLEDVVEEACEEGDAACKDAEGDALNTDEEGDGPDAEKGVDPKVAWRRRVARGKQVFIKRCDFCHPDGDEDTGPKLRGIRWPTGKIVSIVRKGKGKMKPMPPSKISSAQMKDLLAYLSTIRTARGVKRP